MRRSSLLVAALGLAALGLAFCVRPSSAPGTPLPIPRDSVERFVACMGWPRVASITRITGAKHYVRHDAPADTLGATDGRWVWVKALPDSVQWQVIRHEWVHLVSGSPAHIGPQWTNATACGGPPLIF